MSTIARTLPSSASTSFPFSTFTTTGSSTGPAPHGITSSPTPPRAVDATHEAKISTAAGPMVMVSSQETWTPSVRTSLSPIMDTRITQNMDLGTVTNASQVSPHPTQLTRLPTGGTERTHTTTRATSATRVSAPTLEMLTVHRTSGKTANTSTTGLVIATAFVSPNDLERTASSVTSSEAQTSRTVVYRTTPSMYRGRSATLGVPSVAETSTLVPTLGVSYGEPEATTSWDTHPVQASSPASRATLTDSHSKSDSSPAMVTSSAEEVGFAGSTWTASPAALTAVNALITTPETKSTTFTTVLTGSTNGQDTTDSWVTPERTSPAPGGEYTTLGNSIANSNQTG
ncbi:mucin-16-like [Artibeus jamaicensis]|uniref:mucin-16-like n=1 Tax=Artibeus jamaicensis TaxID=9417 RepID=UPI00235AD6D8|nr:mucin-16-like [Artibeus jamaicensis]